MRDSLVSSFFLMAKGEDINRIVNRFIPVKSDVPGTAERDNQFSQFRLFGKRPTHFRHSLKMGKVPGYGLSRAQAGRR